MEKEFQTLGRVNETFTVLSEKASIEAAKTFLKNAPEDISLDIETTSVDPYCGNIVLTTLQVGNTVITFDNISIPVTIMLAGMDLHKKSIIAHNALFEILWFQRHKCDIRNIYCTMLAEQKLFQGAEDIRFNIVDTLLRRGFAIPEDMNKDVRADFSATYNTHELKHVLYNQADTLLLAELKKRQAVLIDSFELQFYIKQIHFPLIRILAKAQLEGLVINEPKFAALAQQAEQTMKALEEMMNIWVKTHYPNLDLIALNKPLKKALESNVNRVAKSQDRLAKVRNLISKYEAENKTHLKAYKLSVEAVDKILKDLDEAAVKSTELQAQEDLKWSSTDQVVSLLEALKCKPMPLVKDQKTKKFKPSLGRASREKWLLKNKGNPLYALMETFDKYMGYTKHVNSFGLSFLSKYKHPVTGKYHTSYKQGTVATGRLASGDSDAVPPKFNSQQIIADTELRECFGTDPGYDIATIDLSGAELVTMCSLANDLNLLNLSQGDMHSHFANKGWQAIYKHRKLPWTSADVISKEQNKDKRTEYKPMLFGTIYGLKAPKAGETLNVSEKEGQIAIDTIIEEVPDTIKMVTAAVKTALRQGYVVHNDRTKSRRWFYPVLKAKQEDREMTFMERKDVEGGARNCRIQGTQADMLCESMVIIQRFIDLYKLDAVILMQVHDELVIKFNKKYNPWLPEVFVKLMTRTANKYLIPAVRMKADMHCGETWTK
jgi:DNA polymerase I-like protein with 3'-5' exonuclease and polymerase domains